MSHEQHEHDYVSLTLEPLDVSDLTWQAQDDGAGAISTFLGITRDTFEGRLVTSLEYEAYAPMAVASLRRICAQARARWQLKKVVIQHKLGACPVGHASVFVGVSSAHRREAIAAAEYCIDSLKADTPIWKKEHYAAAPPSGSASSPPAAPAAGSGSVERNAEGEGGQRGAAGCAFTWKKNQEFSPRVPLALLRAARAAPAPAATAAAAAAARVEAPVETEAEALSRRLKQKMRRSVCDAAYVHNYHAARTHTRPSVSVSMFMFMSVRPVCLPFARTNPLPPPSHPVATSRGRAAGHFSTSWMPCGPRIPSSTRWASSSTRRRGLSCRACRCVRAGVVCCVGGCVSHTHTHTNPPTTHTLTLIHTHTHTHALHSTSWACR